MAEIVPRIVRNATGFVPGVPEEDESFWDVAIADTAVWDFKVLGGRTDLLNRTEVVSVRLNDEIREARIPRKELLRLGGVPSAKESLELVLEHLVPLEES